MASCYITGAIGKQVKGGVMAGTIVHLVIADMLSKLWMDKKIVTKYGDVRFIYDYFIAGNICPDGIMARKNYERDMKRHTHFRDNIKDSDFHKEENLALFRQRLNTFVKENLEVLESAEEESLYLGYWTHMITDEIFMLQIRPEFFRNISVKGLTENDMESFKYFSKDVDLIDFRLLKEYEGISRIFDALKEIESYEVYNMITKDELTDSRNWIINYFFETEHKNIEEPVFISYERLWKFIRDVVDYIYGFFDVSV